MKYGETLRQRSIPAWSAYNIDYDDIKHIIKEQTTPGQGKAVSVPGRGDDKARQFEDNLLFILEEQHHRIDLFVKSKAREIQHRLDDAKKRLRHLSTRSLAADRRVPVSRIERYGSLENDVLKAGEDIKSLARFTGAQRTAFRKLLKKYKKWTGSVTLEERFKEQVLDDVKSFTKFDLAPLLNTYSETLHDVRTLYETRVQALTNESPQSSRQAPPTKYGTLAPLYDSVNESSRTSFDTAIATLPLSETGTFSSYFVHPDNVVELKVLMLQYMRYLDSHSRSNSISTTSDSPLAPLTKVSSGNSSPSSLDPQFYVLVADDPERFIQEQGALTVDEREHSLGSIPQRASVCARWSSGVEEAVIAARKGKSEVVTTRLKPKHFATLFDTERPLPIRRASFQVKMADLGQVRSLLANGCARPLYQMTASRSRHVGLNNTAEGILLATLDSDISFQLPKLGDNLQTVGAAVTFPFAVLQLRQDGQVACDLAKVLDRSHLVERVRGFSMEYHGIWELYKNNDYPAPFWIPTLSRDIRKLPPPNLRRNASTQGVVRGKGTGSGSHSPSDTLRSASHTSGIGLTDNSNTNEPFQAPGIAFKSPATEAPPLRAFRKKRKRVYPPAEPSQPVQQSYWSEYDHPEDGSEGGDAYMIYIDPNEKSSIEAFFDRVAAIFSRRRKPESERALSSPAEDESSDDEETDPLLESRQRAKSYGALSFVRPSVSLSYQSNHAQNPEIFFLPVFAATCHIASLVILVVGYILAATGKHKFIKTVDAGVVFAVISSLLFAVVGFGSLLRKERVRTAGWVIAAGTLLVAAIGNGGLLAWMLG